MVYLKNKDNPCDACQKGKQFKSSFKLKNVVSTSRPLELIHMDLFGSTRVDCLSGMHYAYVLVNDYSRYTWVCFLAHKNDAFKAFEIFSKRAQKKKVFALLPLEVIMEPNLKMSFSKTFVMKMEFIIHSLLLELLNKMG